MLLEFLRRLFHIGPLTTLVLIKTITLSVIYCSLLWWPPSELGGLLSLTTFLITSGMVMFNFFCAISKGPGYLPLGWNPANPGDRSKLQYCSICKGYKAPRAHHCRKCGRCVIKLDHHCPWINTCVGHFNHCHFIAFLSSAMIGCSHATVILVCSLYRALYRNYYLYNDVTDVPYVYLGLYGFIWVLFSCGCAVGVALGVTLLLYFQLKVVLKNETSIEEWILEKATFRRKFYPTLPPFSNPYNLGWRDNLRFVMNWSCSPRGNGVDWPVAPGCDQYSMTVEQLEQKNDKKRRMREVRGVEVYSGSWCPITKGLRVVYQPPCSDEPRLPILKEDRVLVTRWKKHWVYGEKMEDGAKGWFPRRCVVEVIYAAQEGGDCSSSEEEEKKDK